MRKRDLISVQLLTTKWFLENFWKHFSMNSLCPGFCTRIYRAHRILRACARMRAYGRTLGRTLTHLHAFASPTEHRECSDYATSHDTVDGYIERGILLFALVFENQLGLVLSERPIARTTIRCSLNSYLFPDCATAINPKGFRPTWVPFEWKMLLISPRARAHRCISCNSARRVICIIESAMLSTFVLNCCLKAPNLCSSWKKSHSKRLVVNKYFK